MQTTESERMSPDPTLETLRRRLRWTCRTIIVLAGIASATILYGAMHRPEWEWFAPVAVWGWAAAVAAVILLVATAGRKLPGKSEPEGRFSISQLAWSMTSVFTVYMVGDLGKAMRSARYLGRPDNSALLLELAGAYVCMLYLLGVFRRRKPA